MQLTALAPQRGVGLVREGTGTPCTGKALQRLFMATVEETWPALFKEADNETKPNACVAARTLRTTTRRLCGNAGKTDQLNTSRKKPRKPSPTASTLRPTTSPRVAPPAVSSADRYPVEPGALTCQTDVVSASIHSGVVRRGVVVELGEDNMSQDGAPCLLGSRR